MKYTKLHIEYANQEDSLILSFNLRVNPLVTRWVDCVLRAQKQYSIDHPDRFYGFGSLMQQSAHAIETINRLVYYIEKNSNIIIGCTLYNVHDQETLNFLHSIFEVNHGLLDKESTVPEVKKALSDLNIAVHRCESIQRGAMPRHVVTWFGLPKTEKLTDLDYALFEQQTKFGTIYLNYVEIGKTLLDLSVDNDSYISDEAFQPFKHFSADFVVKFWDSTNEEYTTQAMDYYNKHRDFFEKRGYSWEMLSKSIGAIPVADIIDSGIDLEVLENHQFIKSVRFS
jgi:hypothetical protein